MSNVSNGYGTDDNKLNIIRQIKELGKKPNAEKSYIKDEIKSRKTVLANLPGMTSYSRVPTGEGPQGGKSYRKKSNRKRKNNKKSRKNKKNKK